ncbi:MAG: symporter-like protein, partial [Alphaproteobacteria bacterium]|nr:symporter-like protein [Alphaproteobacteria bacterium]
MPAPYAGLAMAAVMTGLFLPFLPPAVIDAPAIGLIGGFSAGFAIAALGSGVLLRKTGAFSLPDLVASRFPGAGIRFGVVAVVCAAAGAVALAGLDGAIHALSLTIGAPRSAAAALAALVLALMIAPGGMAGIVWAATGAAGIFVAALALPLTGIVLSAEPLPLPVLGDAAQWRSASALVTGWQSPPAQQGGALLAFAAGLGLAALAPLIAPAVSVPDAASARRAGLSALFWTLAAAVILLTTICVAALAAQEWLVGERPDRLPVFAYAASSTGLLAICGKFTASPQTALDACAELTGFAGLVLRPQDFTPSGLWLVLGMPELRGYGVAFSGLAGAGLIAIGMVLAASGFQAVGTALGHDMLYRVRESAALTSRRL